MATLMRAVGPDLTEGVGVRGHVGQDDQDVHAHCVGQVLRRSQGQPRRDDALDGRQQARRPNHRPTGRCSGWTGII